MSEKEIREWAEQVWEEAWLKCSGPTYLTARERSIDVIEAALAEKDREIERWKKRAERYKKALRAIRNYKPIEVLKDEFAYDRMVKSYRDAAHAALVDEK